MTYSPMFGDFVGPWRKTFAWAPVRTFDGCLIWLRPYRRRRVQLHDYLPGPVTQWWFNVLGPAALQPGKPDREAGE